MGLHALLLLLIVGFAAFVLADGAATRATARDGAPGAARGGRLSCAFLPPSLPSRRCNSSRTTISGSGRTLTPMTCGLEVQIRIRGKKAGGEAWLNDAYDEYEKRLRPSLALSTTWHKTDDDLLKAVESDKGAVLLLDEGGKAMDSVAFSRHLYESLEKGGSRVTMVIGGAEGLPEALKRGALASKYPKLSLSKMTFTHVWARVLLAEQIYRASEIHKGSKYHKV